MSNPDSATAESGFLFGKMAKNRPLTHRQRAFIWEYLNCFNAAEAARRAGYKTRSNEAGRFAMTNPDIRRAIEDYLRARAMSADEVLARLAAMARGNLLPFVTDTGTIDLTSDIARENMFLLKKVRVKERRGTNDKNEDWEEIQTEIELHDPQVALVQLGRNLALFTDKKELTITWREKAKELGYNPDDLIQQFASTVAKMDNRSSGGGSNGIGATE